jgi:DNA-directed RNA polymerase specialized sigma24 family protein
MITKGPRPPKWSHAPPANQTQVMSGEFAGRIVKLLGSAPDKEREVLGLRVYWDSPPEETAEAVGSAARGCPSGPASGAEPAT